MQNIIFNKSEYNNLPDKVKASYTRIGSNVYALNPNQMEFDRLNLPWWMTVEQYNRFKSIVEPYYKQVSRGFGPESVTLMMLKPNLAISSKREYAGTRFTQGTRISEEQFWKLPAHEKTFYEPARSRGETYYVRKTSGPKYPKQRPSGLNRQGLQKSVVRTPTTGIKKPPIGLWLDIK